MALHDLYTAVQELLRYDDTDQQYEEVVRKLRDADRSITSEG